MLPSVKREPEDQEGPKTLGDTDLSRGDLKKDFPRPGCVQGLGRAGGLGGALKKLPILPGGTSRSGLPRGPGGFHAAQTGQ